MGQRQPLLQDRKCLDFTQLACGDIHDDQPDQGTKELFRTHRSFCIFLGTSKESDVESRGGEISRLSLPDHELRKFRDELCLRMFGKGSTNSLSTRERIMLAKAMKRQFNSSSKQLARLTGLVFKEVAGLL